MLVDFVDKLFLDQINQRLNEPADIKSFQFSFEWRSKYLKEIFFVFHHEQKEVKAGLRGNFQIASFPYGNAENMFYNFVVLFFSSVRNGGRNSMRVHRTCSIFFFRKKTAGENSIACHKACSVFF